MRCRHAIDADAVVVVGGEGFLDIDGLAGIECHNRIRGVGGGWGGDIDGVDVGVGDEILCVGVPSGYVVGLCKSLGAGSVAAHDSYNLGVVELGKGGERAAFGGFAAANEAPSDDVGSVHGVMESDVLIFKDVLKKLHSGCKIKKFFVILHSIIGKNKMKQIKYTLKVCAQHWREWGKLLWRDYLMLAVATAVVLVASVVVGRDTLLPLWIVGQELGDWQFALSVVPLSPVWLAVLVVGVVAMAWGMIRAHRAMRRVVGLFDPMQAGRQQKAAIVTLLVMLMTLLVVVLWLPTVTLSLSAMAAAYSGLMQDAVATPAWMWVAYVPCGAMAMMLCEVAMTFCRLCLRRVPEKMTASDAIEDSMQANY